MYMYNMEAVCHLYTGIN